VPEKWENRFVDGLLRLARRHKVQLCGGDTSRSPAGVFADIAVVGRVKRGTALLRSRAKVGDRIYVTGELGEAAAVLKLLKSGKIRKRDLFPAPRIQVGEWLHTNGVASAAIDISDGLSTDLSHICEESRVGATVYADRIPIHSVAQRQQRTAARARSLGGAAMDLALHGGEDYELLFTAPKSKRVPAKIAGVQVTHIGEIMRGKQIRLAIGGKSEILSPKGWEHFRDR
jgi:thiamine-monophosphate kinase